MANSFGADVSIESFFGSIEIDGQAVVFDEVTIQEDSVDSAFGEADRFIRISENTELTHTLTLLKLSNPEAYIATHSVTFKEDVGIDGITGFQSNVPRNDETRLAYGPADNTSYQVEDYLNIPAIPGYSKSGNMLFGGVPFNYVWNRDGGLFVGVLASEPDTFELPITVNKTNVELAHHYYPDSDMGAQTDFSAGETLTLPPIMAGLHRGDYFTPLRSYVEALEIESGKDYIDVALGNSEAANPYWKTWGLDKTENGAFTVDQVRSMADLLEQRGINRIMLDYGWFVTEGVWEANEDPGFVDDDDLIALIAELNARGFQVGLWYQPLQVDPSDDTVVATLLQHAIRNEDGSLFIDDDDLALLDPSNPAVLAYVAGHFETFEAFGVEHLYLDSQMAQLASPANFALARPLASHEALSELYDLIRAEGETRGITIEICPDGRSQTLLNMPQAVTNIGDPKNDRQLRAEHRWLKAIQGSSAVVGTYVETFPDNGTSGSFLNLIGIGGNIQSIGDFTSLQNPEWDLWLSFYNEHQLVTADYLPLYDIAFDYPEGHVLRRDDVTYYSFFAKTEGSDICSLENCIDAPVVTAEFPEDANISESVDLRGLEANTQYQVTSFPDASIDEIIETDDDGDVAIDLSFTKEILLMVTPTDD